MLGFLQHPTIATIYMILLAASAINYGFLAFDKNPLAFIIKKGGSTFEKIVYIIIGLVGIHFLIQTFQLMQYTSQVEDQLRMVYSKGRELIQQAAQQDEMRAEQVSSKVPTLD